MRVYSKDRVECQEGQLAAIRDITRPLSWFPPFAFRRQGAAKPDFHASGTEERQVQVFDNVVKLPYRLDADWSPAVMAAVTRVAAQVHAQTYPHLVLDLRSVDHLGTAGIFTLHAAVMAVRGQTPPELEDGWHAIRTAAEANLAAGREERLRAVNASPRVEAHLRANCLDRCLTLEPAN